MKLSILSPIGLAALATSSLAACGDPLVTKQDRGDAVFGLHGQVAAGADGAPTDDYQVAVLFLRVLIDRELFGRYTLETEVIPDSRSGSFPAQFQVELTEVPTVYPYDLNIIYGNLFGAASDGVFATTNAPDAVRIGHLVIGPPDELAALPAQLAFSLPENRALGNVLAPYLPHTTITSYQVIYAEGVEPGDVIYPTYTYTSITGGMAISDGFTIIDARTYFDATIWQECAGERLASASQTELDDFQVCEQKNAALIQCVDGCLFTGDSGCKAECRRMFPGQIDRIECAMQAIPELFEQCGPLQEPRPEQLHILDPLDPLSVTVPDDDIKAGLWVEHASYLN